MPASANAESQERHDSKGYVLMDCGGQTCLNMSFVIWALWIALLVLIILPIVYWNFRNKQEERQTSFIKFYWRTIKEAFLWFRWSNIIAIALTAIWVGFAHSQIGDALGHSILVLALLHTIITAFEHQLGKFAETPERIIKTIREEIAKSIKDQRVYVSGLQATGVDEVLEAIRHKETLKDSRHGFALVRFNADVGDYAAVCEECLEQTKKSIKSMSDFDFDEGFLEFCNGKPALDWTKKVNYKANNSQGSLKVHRVQVMTYSRLELVKNLNKYSLDKNSLAEKQVLAYARVVARNGEKASFLKKLLEGLGNYKNFYWKTGGDFRCSVLLRTTSELGKFFYPVAKYLQHDKLACGEFILFDDDVLVRYSPSSKLLEVLIGKPVKEFSGTFAFLETYNATCDFTNFEDFFHSPS